ncbi:endolytic transglycosylase MltG [bacterium]|nr:endolytic transglycosylase MltG [bacterium]
MNQIENFFSHIKVVLIRREVRIASVFLALLFVCGGAVSYFISPPSKFPVGSIVKIEEGETLRSAGNLLRAGGLIRSVYSFELISRMSFAQGKVVAGEYLFNEPENVWKIVARLGKGDFNIPRVKVRIQEGMTISDISIVLKAAIPNFDANRFALVAQGREGYLFPDTYDFSERITPEDAVLAMTKNFEKNIAPLRAEIALFGHTLAEIVAMASIIEKEAGTDETRKMVSGILWRRIEEDIPLQVDAAFNYVNGKNTFQLSLEDLRVDSPYNTYRYKGLPPTPIANPGINSIEAALRPTDSPYFFYLSDKAGNMHYAEDFEGHKKNKRKYLN